VTKNHGDEEVWAWTDFNEIKTPNIRIMVAKEPMNAALLRIVRGDISFL
jgi:hypothetical protein